MIIYEIICDDASHDPGILFSNMARIFYPWLSEADVWAKFAGFVEYPTPLGRFLEICRHPGFQVSAQPVNEIVAEVLLRKA